MREQRPAADGRVAAMRVAVVGAGGKMGREVCRAVLAEADLELVAAVDPGFDGLRSAPNWSARPPGGLAVSGELDGLESAATEVAVDFTLADAGRSTCDFCAAHGIHAVVGTTGFSEEDLGRSGLSVRRPRRRHAQLRARRQLRHRRRAHDALRRAGRAVVRRSRDHRAAPRRQAGRAVGHGDAHGRADGRGPRLDRVRARPTGRRRPRCRGPAAEPGRPGCASTRSGSPASSLIRRSSSAPWARA